MQLPLPQPTPPTTLPEHLADWDATEVPTQWKVVRREDETTHYHGRNRWVTRTEHPATLSISPRMYFLYIVESTGAEIDWEGMWPPMAPVPAPVEVTEEVDLEVLMLMESPFDALEGDFWAAIFKLITS